jgi:hypothetical protein
MDGEGIENGNCVDLDGREMAEQALWLSAGDTELRRLPDDGKWPWNSIHQDRRP